MHSLSSQRWHATGSQGREPTADHKSVHLRENARPSDYSVLEMYYRRWGIGFTGTTHLLHTPNDVCWLGSCPQRLVAQLVSPSSLQTEKAVAAPPRVGAVVRHVAT